MDDELEPVTNIRLRAFMLATELREVADVIEENPELMLEDKPYDAAQRMLVDLDVIDGIDLDGI